MRDHLRGIPIHLIEGSLGEADEAFHFRGTHPDFNGYVESVTTCEVRQWLRITVGARSGWFAERLERIECDDPRRDSRRKTLREEGTERLILPALEVARRPIVEQTKAEQVIFGIGDRDGLAEWVALADEE